MGTLRDHDLSSHGERALKQARDIRPFAGDLYMRAAVLASPSPSDVVCLLDDAAGAQAFGQCVRAAAARRLLQNMAAQPWVMRPAEATARKGSYEVSIAVGGASRTLHVQRFPRPHVVMVSA